MSLPRNRSIPEALVIPVLHYPDLPAAVTWLREAFGFTERLRIAGHRVQLDAGPSGGAVVAVQGDPAAAPADRTAHSILVRIENADAHCERARRAGATIVRPPTTYPFGERQYSVVDPGGHAWTFSETVADSDPASWGGEWVGEGHDAR